MDKSKRLKISTRFKFDLPALLQLAEKLRQIPCSCDEFQEPLQGGLNCVIILTFEDGVEWIFRFPHTNCGVSKEFASLLLSSEVATLKYVKENSSIPVPAVFDYRLVDHRAPQTPRPHRGHPCPRQRHCEPESLLTPSLPVPHTRTPLAYPTSSCPKPPGFVSKSTTGLGIPPAARRANHDGPSIPDPSVRTERRKSCASWGI